MNIKFLNMRKYRAEGEDGGTGGTDAPASGSSDVNDWGDLATDSGDVDGGAIGGAAEPTVPAPAPAPTPTPTEVPLAQPSVAAEQPAQPQPVATTPAEAPAEQPAQVNTPEQIQVLRKNYEDELTKVYGFDQETTMLLQTQPEVVLPRLAARLHLDVLDAIAAQLPNRIAQVVQQVNTATQRETEAKDSFFKDFPDLRGHEQAILRVGAMYRAANPTATREQTIKAIGDFVRTSLGIQPPVSAPSPSSINNPFIPANGSGGGAALPQPNEWEALLREDE